MYEKMQTLSENVGVVSVRETKIGMNKWDRENIEHNYASEESCNQFMNDYIEFSPQTNVWIKRMNLYTQLRSINQQISKGKRADITHFAQACLASMTRYLSQIVKSACVSRRARRDYAN
jgi:hypothetical protein